MTDTELQKLLREARQAEADYKDDPQYGGGLVAELCEEILRLRGLSG